MLRSPLTRWLVGIVAFIAVLGLLRFKPWQRGSSFRVGFLPVT